MLRSTRKHLRLGAGVVAVVILLVPLVSILTRGEARADAPTPSATVLATVRINTLEVSLAAPKSVIVGERFRAIATVKNKGSTKILRAQATLHLPVGISLKGKADKNVGVVLPAKDKQAQWNLMADAADISYVILVTATGTEEESGDLLEAQDTAMIEVVAGPGLPRPEGTLPPSSGENEEGTAPPSDEEHGEGTVPPSDEEHEDGTAPPSDEEQGDGGVIDSALSGLRSVRDFFATLISI